MSVKRTEKVISREIILFTIFGIKQLYFVQPINVMCVRLSVFVSMAQCRQFITCAVSPSIQSSVLFTIVAAANM